MGVLKLLVELFRINFSQWSCHSVCVSRWYTPSFW